MKLEDIIRAERLRLTLCERTNSNPNMEESANMDHWRVRIKGPHGSMSLTFSKGYGHEGKPPKLAEVLDCIVSDASGSDELFESWCSNYGYDTDSRRAERTYNAVRKQAAALRRILGPNLYAVVLEAERL